MTSALVDGQMESKLDQLDQRNNQRNNNCCDDALTIVAMTH